MEILIVQMGKVASTAIAEALRRDNIEVLQAHIASPARLQEKLRTMTGPVVSDEVASRMYQDYLQELRVTFLLARQLVAGAGGGQQTRVISLTRDPLSWYWSHFAQNYDHYQTLLQKFFRFHYPQDASFDPGEVFAEVQGRMFAVLEQTAAPLDDAGALMQLMAEADAIDPTGVVFSQLNRFLVPLRWFDEDFLPGTGLDVYDFSFDRETGSALIESGGFSLLLLRYENLLELAPRIAQFAGVEELQLARANISEDKHIPFSIKTMQKNGQAMIPAPLAERIYATRYARHFGYSFDASWRSLEQTAAGAGAAEGPTGKSALDDVADR
ncbi:putative capsular polysaccharide synthesis family protein [Haliea sp. E1-2-M8]|uniref:putative capsular polysaccharide synthesis family protein n=1 Tax=Haliea sp. E1-2-M8 TaxID=3064706 RepID=UPI002723678F|nr:putative capsular polysaccharide synthesis family protein [Haliea sp. E1-2-M8]MDO8862513.1 putative capsular polysaccharide synthesis family protein [Haliea sp. E1-2-M8]